MSFWRATAAHGGGYDDQAMNVAFSLPVIPSRADGEGPHEVRRMFEACEVLRFAQDDAQ